MSDIATSIEFYVEGLGFDLKDKWVDEGVLKWCHLQIGEAGQMLQQYKTKGQYTSIQEQKGEGVTLCFFCDNTVHSIAILSHGVLKRQSLLWRI